MRGELLNNRIDTILEQHTQWRASAINLIPSENVLSPRVRSLINNDLVQRYGDYNGRNLADRKYMGTDYLVLLEQEVESAAKVLFRCHFVELRPLSGHVAGAAAILSLCRPGCTVLEPGPNAGGHRLAQKLKLCNLIDLKVEFLPFDGESYNLDLEKSIHMMRELRPRLVILGTSAFLFPHPVSDIVQVARELGDTYVLYDASHVLGLVAAGQFQDPLTEGADLVIASTHKTFFGPQGGIIYTNDPQIAEDTSSSVSPGLVSNHHCFRIPALGAAIAEMLEFGPAYASQVVRNAQELGRALDDRGLVVIARRKGFTQSHTILLDARRWGSARDLARKLSTMNIMVGDIGLPDGSRSGIRVGTQEITRLGATESDMWALADIMVAALDETENPGRVQSMATEFRRRFDTVGFC